MDHEESEEERQAEQGPIEPSEHSPGQEKGGRARPDSESERHAFAVLERFSGELEEILQSLERARSTRAPGESTSPPPPEEPPYRPSSIRFERGPISTRVDFSSLPPLPKPQSPSHTGVRLVFESSFLILVAAISALAELRPLLIAAAETAAFLIVALVEFAVARDRRSAQFGQILASPPASGLLRTGELEAGEAAQLTFDEIEPLVWKTERQALLEASESEASEEPEPAAKANWALAPVEPEIEPTEEEKAETVPASSLEEAVDSTAESYSVPAAPRQAQGETTALTPIEPAASTVQENGSATEPEAAETPVRKHRLFSRRERGEGARLSGETRIEPEAEPEIALEHTVDIPAPPETAAEGEPEPEPEPEPDEIVRRRWFGARRSEPAEEPEAEDKVEPEPEPEPKEHRRRLRARASEPTGPAKESEAEAVSKHTVDIPAPPETAAEGEPEPEPDEIVRRRWFGARESAPIETPEGETEPEAKAETKEHRRWLSIREDNPAEPLDNAEPAVGEVQIEPEIRRHFHLLKQEPGVETDAFLEHAVDIPAPPEKDLAAEVDDVPRDAVDIPVPPETAAEAKAVPEDTVDIPPPPETTAEAEDVHTVDIPAPPESGALAELEPEPKGRHRRFGARVSEPAEPAVEPDIEAETRAEAEKATSPTPKPKPSSEPVVPISESEEERARAERRRRRAARRAGEPLEPERSTSRRRVARRGKTEQADETEGRPASEPSAEAMPELGEPTGETDGEAATAAAKTSARRALWRFRPGARAKIDTPERAGGYVLGLPHDTPQEVEGEAPAELGAATFGGETTAEIELPPEVPVGEIERTLSELGARKAPQPKRRWLFGVGAEDEDSPRAADEEGLDDAMRFESELRLAAERERRRREREYQRALRDRVK